jgi:sulfite reductase (NADPH) flavoprotein alpha-component
MMRSYLLQVHRWLALLLTPLFLLITLTGMVLALKPVLADLSAPPYTGAVEVSQVQALLESASADGPVVAIERSATSGQWVIPALGEYRLSDGVRVGPSETSGGAFFDWIKDLHKDLLVDAGWLVEWATWAMLAIVVAGILLGWPKFKQSLLGWHQFLGVWLFPLVLLLPLTGILMTLHVARPDLGLQRGAEPTSLQQGLEQAAGEHNLSGLISARGFKSGSLLIETEEAMLVVSGDQVTPIDLSSNWPKMLHEGLWGGWVSGLFNMLVGMLVMGLTLTGFISWLRRRQAARISDIRSGAEVLIVFASQTGTAQGLATATAATFEKSGIIADQGSIAAFPASKWHAYQQVLVICSTTGEGELPDNARSWVSGIKARQLEGVSFSLLALGDRRYTHFCAGGQRLRTELIKAGAHERLTLHEVDGDPAVGWQQWLRQLAEYNNWNLQIGGMAVQRQRCEATLIERTRLDTPMGDDSPHSYSLTFAVPESTRFAPGDLFQFQPRPDAEPRTYSVGSDYETSPGKVRLTVGLLRYETEQGNEVLGLGSSELCLNWPLNESRSVELVAHPGFNPPQNSEHPMILVATGCGIAPFIGFLEARAATDRKGPVWLLFGNRHEKGDFLYGEQIKALKEQGVITNLDTVFSRDGGDQRYITERIEHRGDQLLEWINRGANLYICGRASTLGRGIDGVLMQLLQRKGASKAEAEAELARWVNEGIMHRDLFD